MTNQEKLAQALLRPINPALVIVLGIYTVAWGIWLILPWTTFGTAPVYSVLAQLMPEWCWGVIAICMGIITVWGAWKRQVRWLKLGALVAHFHWLVIAILYFVADIASTNGITSLTFATYAGLVWVNLRVNGKRMGKHE